MLKLHKNETKEKVVIIDLSHIQNVEIPQKFKKMLLELHIGERGKKHII
jgi:hypothetical protein